MNSSAASPFAVVVSSCDAYADLWPYFFHFLFRYWPDVPQPVYLISARKRYDDPRVATLALGEDKQWSNNLLAALDRIPAPTVLYFQDDYLLNAPVDPANVARLIEFFKAKQAAYLCVDHQDYLGTPTETPGIIAPSVETPWVVGLQAALWSQEALRAMVVPGWTPWKAEEMLNLKAKELGARGFYGVTKELPIGIPYDQSVRGRLWLAGGVAHCRAHGLEPDLRLRGCARFREGGPLNRFYRSWQKRRNRRWRRKLRFDQLTVVSPVVPR